MPKRSSMKSPKCLVPFVLDSAVDSNPMLLKHALEPRVGVSINRRSHNRPLIYYEPHPKGPSTQIPGFFSPNRKITTFNTEVPWILYIGVLWTRLGLAPARPSPKQCQAEPRREPVFYKYRRLCRLKYFMVYSCISWHIVVYYGIVR